MIDKQKRIDHLLFCLGEECGELQQAVGKAGRFGIGASSRKTGMPNLESIQREFNDVLAMYEMMMLEVDESIIDYSHNEEWIHDCIETKKAKVKKYINQEKE